MKRHFFRSLVVLAIGIVVGSAVSAQSVPMRGCAGCHPAIYASYLRHGMSKSLGALENPPRGKVAHPQSGRFYEMVERDGETELRTTFPDGGIRTQRVVGQIGAGIFDISYATAELDPMTGRAVNRLFFAPVETVTGHGLELSPFEHSERPSGIDMALTDGCLTCHTDTDPANLPGASAQGDRVYPGHALGVDAFDHLEPLGCEACHGDSRKHMELMTGLTSGEASELGLAQLASLPAGVQRDVCARCHLQGDVRFEMVSERPSLEHPLAAQFPTLVTTTPGNDFRFVGQIERLALSGCFKATPSMTCTTCHDPHVGAGEQGIASFERACVACHDAKQVDHTTCSRSAGLKPSAVTGREPRGEMGCVDCHVRQSQPFDLPGVHTSDHHIRRRIPRPEDVPFRSLTKPGSELRVWDDGRLAPLLAEGAGKKWRDGVMAMGLVQSGRFQEVLALFDRFPEPGSEGAVRPTAPAPLRAVETWPTFHQLRGMALLGARRPAAARAAFGDALRLDPDEPAARIARARMALITGDRLVAMQDTQHLIETFPESEAPWHLRAMMARNLGRPDFQVAGLEAMVVRWPSDAGSWMQLAELYRAAGNEQKAAEALRRVELLRPSLLAPPAGPGSADR